MHRLLTDEEIARIAGTYHAWRGDAGARKYEDLPGFCRSTTIEKIRGSGYVLMPGRYVGSEDVKKDGEPFEEKMHKLTAKLSEHFQESARLDAEIRNNLKELGYEI